MEIFSSPEFWVAVAFFVFVGALFRPGGRIVTGALDARAERIRAQLDEAQRLREEAQHLLAEYQRKQRQAIQDAEAILNQARATAERHREDSVTELEQALERRERQAMDRIAQAEAEALAEVRGIAVVVSVEATRKLLAKSIDDAKADQLIDAAIAELPDKVH